MHFDDRSDQDFPLWDFNHFVIIHYNTSLNSWFFLGFSLLLYWVLGCFSWQLCYSFCWLILFLFHLLTIKTIVTFDTHNINIPRNGKGLYLVYELQRVSTSVLKVFIQGYLGSQAFMQNCAMNLFKIGKLHINQLLLKFKFSFPFVKDKIYTSTHIITKYTRGKNTKS